MQCPSGRADTGRTYGGVFDETISGKSVYGAVAIGKISVFRRQEVSVKRVHTEDTPGEIKRVEQAEARAAQQLQEIYDKALREVGETNAQIFAIHQMMLEDEDYNDSIRNIIETQKVNAEYAVAVTSTTLPRCSALWMMPICRPDLPTSRISPTALSGI